MLGTNGERYVPHYKAIDVASDNRLAPGQAVTTTHLFEADCEAPRFSAKLFYRNSPAQWMQSYGWTYDETLMTEAVECSMRMHWSFILVGLFATISCQEDGKLLGTSSAVSPSKSPLIIEADQDTGRVSATLEAGELRKLQPRC